MTPRQPTHSTVFLASLCSLEHDVRAARRNMVPFIWTHSRTCATGAKERETEMVRDRQRETKIYREAEPEKHTQCRDQKQRETEKLRIIEEVRDRKPERD